LAWSKNLLNVAALMGLIMKGGGSRIFYTAVVIHLVGLPLLGPGGYDPFRKE